MDNNDQNNNSNNKFSHILSNIDPKLISKISSSGSSVNIFIMPVERMYIDSLLPEDNKNINIDTISGDIPVAAATTTTAAADITIEKNNNNSDNKKNNRQIKTKILSNKLEGDHDDDDNNNKNIEINNPCKEDLKSIETPKTAFQLFCDDGRDDIIERLKSVKDSNYECKERDITSMLQKAWKNISKEDEKYYKNQEKKEKTKYNKNILLFEKKYPKWLEINNKKKMPKKKRVYTKRKNKAANNSHQDNKIDDSSILLDFKTQYPITFEALERSRGTESTRKVTSQGGKIKKTYIRIPSNSYCLFTKYYGRKNRENLEKQGYKKDEINKKIVAEWSIIKNTEERMKYKKLADKDAERYKKEWVEYMSTHIRDWVEYISDMKFCWKSWKEDNVEQWNKWKKDNEIYEKIDNEINNSPNTLIIPPTYFRKDFIISKKIDEKQSFIDLFENFEQEESIEDKKKAIENLSLIDINTTNTTVDSNNKRTRKNTRKKSKTINENTSKATNTKKLTGVKRTKKSRREIIEKESSSSISEPSLKKQKKNTIIDNQDKIAVVEEEREEAQSPSSELIWEESESCNENDGVDDNYYDYGSD